MSVKNVFSNVVTRGSAVQRPQQSLEQLIARARKNIDTQYRTHVRHSRHARDAMVVTTTAWQSKGIFIKLYCNPSDMRWSLPRRGTVIKTAAGAVRNTWRNRYRGTYYDEGTVGITFQTGNIMPSAAWQNDAELGTVDNVASAVMFPRVPPGLEDLYRFMELLDQPMLLGATENRHILIHHSRAFPNLIMEGYFLEDGFNFSELSTDGNRVQWEATFQIYRTSPPLNSASRLRDKYLEFIDTNREEAYGSQNMGLYLYPDGVTDIPEKMPTTPSTQGPAAAKKPTTVATLSDKTKALVDKAADRLKRLRIPVP